MRTFISFWLIIAISLLFSQPTLGASLWSSKDILHSVWGDNVNAGVYLKRKLVWGDDGSAYNVSIATPWPVQGPILTQIDTDLNTFSAQNHLDLTLIDTDLLNFKSANHTDLLLLDTDLLNFKSANHVDLSAINTTQTNATQIVRPELSIRAYAGNAYGIAIYTVNVSATETPVLYINNPVGSGKTLFIVGGLLAADINSPNWVRFFIYDNPTITANGTIQAVTNLLMGSANTSVASVYTLPTASANGTLVDMFLDGGANSAGNPKINFSPMNNIIIPAGNKLLITGSAKGNNTPLIIILKWFEV